jgi:hypothetical protein
MEDLLLSVSSPPEIDLDTFSYWVEGRTTEECSHYKIEYYRKSGLSFGLEFPFQVSNTSSTLSHSSMNNSTPTNQYDGSGGGNSNNYLSSTFSSLSSSINQNDCIKYEINDQYSLFQLLEHYLCLPHLLSSQTLCILSPNELKTTLIDRYWNLDDIFIREVLSKKLTKNRKDLEDISENTGLNLRRVTRQYENLKRIYSYFEENNHLITNLYTFISKQFFLNSNHLLSKKYACIIFLLYHKFNVMGKKRIMKLPIEK